MFQSIPCIRDTDAERSIFNIKLGKSLQGKGDGALGEYKSFESVH